MTPITQNDPRLHAEPSIEPYGCFFRTIGQICEAAAGKVLSDNNIIEMYRWLVDEGGILDEQDKRAWIADWDKVGQAAQYYLGVPQTFRYVYRHDLDGSGDDFGSRDQANYFAVYADIKGYGIGHMFASTQNGDRLWDPFWPASEVAEIRSIRGVKI